MFLFEISSPTASKHFTLLLGHLWVLVARYFSLFLHPHPGNKRWFAQSRQRRAWVTLFPKAEFVALSYWWWDFTEEVLKTILQSQKHLPLLKYKFMVEATNISWVPISAWFQGDNRIRKHLRKKETQQRTFREWYWWFSINYITIIDLELTYHWGEKDSQYRPRHILECLHISLDPAQKS